eukprot:1886530-Pyramimonas_sp.AAC.2
MFGDVLAMSVNRPEKLAIIAGSGMLFSVTCLRIGLQGVRFHNGTTLDINVARSSIQACMVVACNGCA